MFSWYSKFEWIEGIRNHGHVRLSKVLFSVLDGTNAMAEKEERLQRRI